MNKDTPEKANLSSIVFSILLAIVLIFISYDYKSGFKTFHNITNGHTLSWVFGFLFLLAVFLFGREFICWYFKINKRISLLEKIEENTRK